MPTQSKDSEGCGLSALSAHAEYASARMPIGRLMRKIQCHEWCSMR